MGGCDRMSRPIRESRATVSVLLTAILVIVASERDVALGEEEAQDPAHECMLAVPSPEEDYTYDKRAPAFEVLLSWGCPCPSEGKIYEVEIRVSRESNRRHLNATTPFHCNQLRNEGAILDMLDLRDGRWEGFVAIHALGLSVPVRFSYITESRPQALPPPILSNTSHCHSRSQRPDRHLRAA